MPVATVSKDTEKHPLKTLEGGFVVLKRMSYGQKLSRQAMISDMKMTGTKKEFAATLNLANEKVTKWEFGVCVVDHNLEEKVNDAVRKLDLKKPEDIDKLDPRVGEEIASFIGKMNNFEEEAEEGN